MKRIATRKIEFETFETAQGGLSVHGRLHDNRFNPFIGYTGERYPAGYLHDLRVVIEISLPDMTITGISVSFNRAPMENCPEIAEAYQGLVGIQVGPGYTREVLSRLGGSKGCAHLTHLIIAMGPAIVQGAFAYYSRIRSDESIGEPLGRMNDFIHDSCHVWKGESC